jgi:tetratricopeptide (TPR) repeat protein
MTGQDLQKYYKILDVNPDTPWKDIKRAYHDLMKIWHPDRFAGDQRLQKIVEEKTKELTHAFKKIEEDYHSIKFYYDPLDEAKESSIETETKPQTEPPVKDGKPQSSSYTRKQEAEEWLKKANETGDYHLILDYLNKAIDLDPYLEEAYLERAETHVMMGNHEQAIEDFNEVIKLSPKLFKGFRGRANVYSELGKHSQAITDFTCAIELEPVNYPELYYLRGKSHEKLGNRHEAKEDFKNAKVLRILRSESHGSQTSSELIDEWKIEEKGKMSFKQVRLHVTAIICVLVGVIALLPIFLSKDNGKGKPKKEITKVIEVPASPSKTQDEKSALMTASFERKKPIKKKVHASTPAEKEEPSIKNKQESIQRENNQQIFEKKNDQAKKIEIQTPEKNVESFSSVTSPDRKQQKPTTVTDDPYKKIKAIVLKNGNVIEGKILSWDPDIVKIQTKDGKVLSYDFKKEVQTLITE